MNKASSILEDIYHQLDEIYIECHDPNWDYDGAEGITSLSLNYSKEFVELLDKVPEPFIAPFGTGEIGFEWSTKKVQATILFSGNGYYHYTIISPINDDYGTFKNTLENRKLFISMLKKALRS